MRKFINLMGQKFNRLTFIEHINKNKWLCRCDCGNEIIAQSGHVKNDNIKSCGCWRKKQITKRNKSKIRHGYCSTKIYQRWQAMLQRCNNPNSKAYKNYGGRGIKVCKRWSKFENFLIDVGLPPAGQYEIDRKKNDGNYCKSNHRWATDKENSRNKRNNRLETAFGKTQCRSAFAEEYSIKLNTLIHRIDKLGLSVEEALTIPVGALR